MVYLNKILKTELSNTVHTCNPSTLEHRQEDLYVFKASLVLVYIVSSRPTNPTQ